MGENKRGISCISLLYWLLGSTTESQRVRLAFTYLKESSYCFQSRSDISKSLVVYDLREQFNVVCCFKKPDRGFIMFL